MLEVILFWIGAVVVIALGLGLIATHGETF